MADLSTEISAKTSALLKDAIAAILSDAPHSANFLPHSAVIVYEYMDDEGRVLTGIFGSDDMWVSDAIGMLEVGKYSLLTNYEADDDDDDD